MRIALWQTTPVAADPEAAEAALEAAATRAADGGADLLVAPEMAMTGYAIGADAAARLAEPEEGRYAEAVSQIARARNLAICYGYPRRAADGGVFNAALLIDRHGVPVLGYDKTHLWGDLDRSMFQPGAALSGVGVLQGWRVSLAICFDIEFPELARAAALAGAELILVPTACMEPWRSVPQRLVPGRAEENGIYISYANYVGSEGDQVYCGHSCLADPYGELAAQAQTEPAMVFADLDKSLIAKKRAKIPYLACRRPELYHSSEPSA